MSLIERTPEWEALVEHHRDLGDVHLRDLFADDPARGETMVVEAAGLYLDYSKNRVTADTIGLLVDLAERAGLRRRIDAMFAGEHINVTEDRPVLHVALRAPRGASIVVDGVDVVPRSTPCSTRWPTSPTGSAPASGPGTPASGSATSSTSGSAAPTSARPWPTRRCGTSPTGT